MNPIYSEFVNRFVWENFRIVSAGWGMIRSDFRLPYDDIAWSKKVRKCNRRKKSDRYNGFNHLAAAELSIEDTTCFPDLVDCYDFYMSLTSKVPGQNIFDHFYRKHREA